MAKSTPDVIDCSEVGPKERKVVERTAAQWREYFMNQVRICKKADGTPHQWGNEAKARLVRKAEAEGIELTNLA